MFHLDTMAISVNLADDISIGFSRSIDQMDEILFNAIFIDAKKSIFDFWIPDPDGPSE